ncbi:MAG: GNAT family N-acetyltransferase [Balneolales bacterium]
MNIREAKKEDIPKLITIISDVFKEYSLIFDEQVELPDFVNFEEHYGNYEHTLFVMEHNNKYAGCGALTLGENGGEVKRVYVQKSFRGQGLGKKLVQHLINVANQQEAPHLHLWTDTRFTIAHHLYLSLGFTRTESQRPLNDINESFEIYFEMNLSNDEQI